MFRTTAIARHGGSNAEQRDDCKGDQAKIDLPRKPPVVRESRREPHESLRE
jgi:hypothetical protein